MELLATVVRFPSAWRDTRVRAKPAAVFLCFTMGHVDVASRAIRHRFGRRSSTIDGFTVC